jgi:DNA-directed RNA polymerase specialized sigma24 family protein
MHTTCPADAETLALLEAVVPTIRRVAGRLALTYRCFSHRLEYDDLVQIGCLACVEVLAHGLHCTGNPAAYLVVVARNAMRRHCGRYASLVATPRKRTGGHYPRLEVLSLDAPVSSGSESTLLEFVAAPALLA